MKYRVHRIDVKSDNLQYKLEEFLNGIDGEIISVFPNVKPVFMMLGGTAKVDYLIVIEKVR
jgi:hypothetical protein